MKIIIDTYYKLLSFGYKCKRIISLQKYYSVYKKEINSYGLFFIKTTWNNFYTKNKNIK